MIGRTGLHALKALAALAEVEDGRYAGAGAIAEEIGAPRNYLGKLLKKLAAQGLVVSQQGLGGGFRLACDPHATTLYDVIEPIDQVSRWAGCFLGRTSCSNRAPCALHTRWQKVRETYLRFLRQTTIADMLK